MKRIRKLIEFRKKDWEVIGISKINGRNGVWFREISKGGALWKVLKN